MTHPLKIAAVALALTLCPSFSLAQDIAPDQWHDLTLRAEGDRFTVFFDGRELFSATDDSFGSPGKVAFWTKADSITQLDRLEIDELP